LSSNKNQKNLRRVPTLAIGTSGYTYSWNEGKPNKLKWYTNQGFNSVEINGSFYRFPSASWVDNWKSNSKKDFVFSIKVHRSITHYTKLKGEKPIQLWKKFRQPFKSIDKRIIFWLFQMPSAFKYNVENVNRIRNFENIAKLGARAVIEFRDSSWGSKQAIKEIENIGFAFCSVNAPELPTKLVSINDTTYLRLHGSSEWYNYIYSKRELDQLVSKIRKAGTNRNAVYLNNDHGMLQNGLYLLQRFDFILKRFD
jgi:uncharacterized protein YecE (DUF72 family)